MSDAVNLFVLGSFVAACSAKVSRLPQPGETVRAQSFALEAGGKGFNVAVAARRLGAEVDGLFAVGTDFLSDFAGRAILAADLPRTMLIRSSGPTGAGIGFIDPTGENCIAVFSGANSKLDADHVDAAHRRVVAAGAVVAQFEIEDAPISRAFAIARANGVATYLNPSPYRQLSPEILRNTDVVVLNEREAAQVCDGAALAVPSPRRKSDPEVWRPLSAWFFDRGVQGVVLTQGPRGALTWRRGFDRLYQPAFTVEPVDTIGAGDSFLAGLVVSLGQGRSWAESLARAAACGALVASVHGVVAALPTATALERFIAAASARPPQEI